MAPPQRCPLCRQTFFCGRGHVYSRKHQRQLKAALERLLPQVEAARKAVRAAQVERYVPEHDRCCWCLCCSCEVQKHLSHGNLTVLHGGLLEHLASPEHKKATNKFWWENKAEVQMKEKFLISPQDYARFKKSMVKSLDSYEEKEDEVIKEMAAQIREVEQSRQEVVRSVLEVGFPRRIQSSIQSKSTDPLTFPGPAFQQSDLLRQLKDFIPHLLGLNSLPVHQGAGLVGEDVGRAGREFAIWAVPFMILGIRAWGHGLGRHLSTLDTFIFPESNSASGRARPRRELLSTWKMEREKQPSSFQLTATLILGPATSSRP
ncbi:centrosomal AT-AC splicing factor isoform X2 [Urocitellus parryii]|uniref:coiled-coil domain-containing protein 84 isoform X2 n=1 Tax=Urocitellus parryii TaxID=9999 RepID=UPI000E560025|nr:coiled-coil domain-containing protein 84 isoform X2 [Urocitellus parryii]